jgi:hypothetical protein
MTSSPVRFKKLAPQPVAPDVVKTAEFYRDELGFKILGYFFDPPVYAMVSRDGAEIHFGKAYADAVQVNESVRKGLGTDVYIWVSDIDQLFGELSSRKVELVEGPIERI